MGVSASRKLNQQQKLLARDLTQLQNKHLSDLPLFGEAHLGSNVLKDLSLE